MFNGNQDEARKAQNDALDELGYDQEELKDPPRYPVESLFAKVAPKSDEDVGLRRNGRGAITNEDRSKAFERFLKGESN